MQVKKTSANHLKINLLVVMSALVCAGVSAAGAGESMKTCPASEALIQMANDGDRGAQFVVGWRLLQGSRADTKTGVEWLQRAAQQGNASAQGLLGAMLLDGKDVSKDPAIAGKWLLRAAEQGNAEAPLRLQMMYTDGVGVPKDRAEASFWRLRTLSRVEKIRVAISSAVSSLPATQGRASIADYLPYAEQGSALAQYTLGRMYFDAPYGQRDEKLGAEWMRKAAMQGHSRAMTDLATILVFGASDVDVDEPQALEWFRAAAKQNYPATIAAMLQMVDRITNGSSYKESRFYWMRQIAELGDANGQNRLAGMYATGTGVATDYAQAVAWYQRSVDQGNSQSQYDLARLYVDGKGVPVDVNKAYFWWALSVKGGRTGGELGTAGYWDALSVSDRNKMDEEVRRWKPIPPAALAETSLQLEKLCAQAN